MYDFFGEGALRNGGAISAPYFAYLREGITRDIDRTIEYYRERSLIVPNTHILVRLIKSMNVSFNRDWRNYVDTANDKMGSLARTLRMTSSVTTGMVHKPGYLYGIGPEVYIADDSRIKDIDAAVANWRELEPVKILRHPFTDMNCASADGKYKGSDEKGLVIASVHFGLLAIQFRCWFEQERHTAANTNEPVAEFLRRYPLNNLLRSHMDVCLFNRLYYTYQKFPIAPYKRVHPFNVIDYTGRLETVFKTLIDGVLDRPRSFEEYLLNLPSLRYESMLETFVLPDVLPTRQVEWALILARMPLITFLMGIAGDRQHANNRHYINRIKESLWDIRNDRSIGNIVPVEIYREFKLQTATYIIPYLDA